MRIAVVSDIHGNFLALEAVIADLRLQSPDIVLQGGDLPYGGCHAAEVMDRVEELGWPGVIGNTDEVLWNTNRLGLLMVEAPKLRPLLKMIVRCAVATKSLIGDSRLCTLQAFPTELRQDGVALMHASPGDLWKSPMDSSDDATLERVYAPLGARIVVYGQIHRPFIKRLPGFTLCNSGSVGMPYDGDPRASYLLLTDGQPEIRRVEYDIEAENESLLASNYPYKEWFAQVRICGAYVPPPEHDDSHRLHLSEE